ncbi:MAG: rod shape-determining protein MreC [Clostridia bacterium]|nr:rod shape-determining protein MreC [Clostridia bacterium]
MRRLLTNRWFMVLCATLLLIAIVIFGAIPNSPVRKLVKPINAVVSPIQKLIKNGGDALDDFFASIKDGIAIREENKELRSEIAELQYVITQNEEARIRYEELKDAFHIKDSFSTYDIYGASILSRDADEWFSIIRVDIGQKDGLSVEDGSSLAVVDVQMNLLGRVIETEADSSKILPLTHEGFTVIGKVNEVNGAIVTVVGDSNLKNQGLCLVTGIDENTVPEVGTEIVTSGDGGLFPQGVPIGVIESVDTTNPLKITATLRPYTQIGSVKDLFIMVPLVTDEGETEVTSVETVEGDANG